MYTTTLSYGCKDALVRKPDIGWKGSVVKGNEAGVYIGCDI